MKLVKYAKTVVASALLTALLPGTAFAQVAKVNSTLAQVQSILQGASVVAFTIAIMWVGYKMAFQHAKWSEVSNIMIGGVFIGGAAAIASMLVA
jgi:type IV secretion system protein VirB2